tara:strand:+ start:4050 stop:4640 length:591 start_codon:yes stop_codon:yes gene_type:complete
MASLFDTLQANAFRAGIRTRTAQSRDWFQKNVTKLKVNRQAILSDSRLDRTATNIRGNMYMYFYDPKHKATLPYYDRFPLTIMVDGAKGGFYGLNLHYLNYNTRAKFLDDLMAFGPATPNESSRLTKLRYNLLSGVQKFKEFKPCFKHYLGEHVKSQFSKVPMTDWEIAIFLPVEQFKKKSKTAVWKESLKIARRP